MKHQISPFKLGIFVLAGAGIAIGALIWVGAVHFFEGGKTYVSFFDHSVKGLKSGSEITHLGLVVGQVSDISLAEGDRLARVKMELKPSFEVKHNYAVQLKMAGITGGDYLAIVEAPADLQQVTPKVTAQTKYPLIPSIPGTLTDIEDALQSAMDKFQKIDFQGLLASLEKISRSAENILSNAEIQGTLRNLNEASAAIRTLAAGVSGSENIRAINAGIASFAAAAAKVQKASDRLAAQVQAMPPKALAQITRRMDRTSAEAERVVSSAGKQIAQSLDLLQQSLRQMNQALTDLKGLARELEEQPGQVLNRPKSSEPFKR